MYPYELRPSAARIQNQLVHLCYLLWTRRLSPFIDLGFGLGSDVETGHVRYVIKKIKGESEELEQGTMDISAWETKSRVTRRT